MASALHNNSSRDFWSEDNKIKQVKKSTPNSNDNSFGKEEVGNYLFKESKKIYIIVLGMILLI